MNYQTLLFVYGIKFKKLLNFTPFICLSELLFGKFFS